MGKNNRATRLLATKLQAKVEVMTSCKKKSVVAFGGSFNGSGIDTVDKAIKFLKSIQK